jgi:hypothetical protein
VPDHRRLILGLAAHARISCAAAFRHTGSGLQAIGAPLNNN